MSAHLKMKTEDIKFIFVSVVLVFSLACCISITKAAVSESNDTGSQEKEVIIEEKIRELDNVCEECKRKEESVFHNLILTGFKICKSCRLLKTIFPI